MSDLYPDPTRRPPEHRGPVPPTGAMADPMRHAPAQGSGLGVAAVVGGVAVVGLLAWFLLAGNDTPVVTEPAAPATTEAPVDAPPAVDAPAAEVPATPAPATEAPVTEPPAAAPEATPPEATAPEPAPEAATPEPVTPDPAAPAEPATPETETTP